MSINRKKLNKIKIIFFRAFKGINWKKIFSRDKTEEAHARSFERMTQKECKLMCMGTSHFVCTQKKTTSIHVFRMNKYYYSLLHFFCFSFPKKKIEATRKNSHKYFGVTDSSHFHAKQQWHSTALWSYLINSTSNANVKTLPELNWDEKKKCDE